MSTNGKCTAEEIAEKRRIAEERHKKYLEEIKKQKVAKKQANIENRLPFHVAIDQMKTSSNVGTFTLPTVLLTSEQKAAIEKNRISALEKAKQNKLIAPEIADGLAAKTISPGKIPASKTASGHRLVPYLKPANSKLDAAVEFVQPIQRDVQRKAPSPSSVMAQKAIPNQNPYQKTTSAVSKSVTTPRVCLFKIISENRFTAVVDKYDEMVINEFKKCNSKFYNRNTQVWSFSFADHETLKNLLSGMKNVEVDSIPEFAMKAIRRNYNLVDESCLAKIEPDLLGSLLEFQKEGVLYGIARGGRFLLGDDMGLGKTHQAIAIADYYKEDWPLLIITTASTRGMWGEKIIELLPDVPLTSVKILETSKDFISDAKIVICSYKGMENNMKKLEHMGFKMIIFDESHSLKNSLSKQTINATKLGQKANRVILLTGTPALSRPAELFAQLDIIDKSYSNWFGFTKRYCDGHNDKFGWKAVGATNLEELDLVLRKNFMIRRTKEDVCTELVEKKREIVQLKDMILTTDLKKSMQNYQAGFKNLEGNQKLQNELLIEWYTRTADLKKDSVCRFVESLMVTSDEKFLVFAHHLCVLDALSDALSKKKLRYVRIDGSTKSEIRNEIVQNFQSDPCIRCAILSIKACGAGITLTAASVVVFAELDWTPSSILQAEGRAHRIGQERQVKSLFLIAPGTADDIIWEKLKEKQRNLSKVGLVANNERLSQNMESSTFEAGPSTSGANNSRISDIFQPKQSDISTSSESFLTCKSAFDDDDEFLKDFDFDAISQAEKEKAKIPQEVAEILDGINFDEEDDFL